ncbi:MAG: hypothetical protein ACYDBX_04870, partial [Patescibacteria group bacterium]
MRLVDNGISASSSVYYSNLSQLSSPVLYTDTNIAQTSPLPLVIEYATSVKYGNYIYEIGGQNSTSGNS